MLRISPVVDSATGTIRVTLETRPQGKLRPGMFARVYLETDIRDDALVIPKAALSLESIGDTVYVVDGDMASRLATIELGSSMGLPRADFVEARSGVEEAIRWSSSGQDGLSDRTPIQEDSRQKGENAARPSATGCEREGGLDGRLRRGRAGGMAQGRRRDPPHAGEAKVEPRFDPSRMTPEQIERAKEAMRARGMTDEQIEQRLKGAGEQSRSQAQ